MEQSMGQRPGMYSPTDISHLAPDPSIDLPVVLIIYDISARPSRHRHWAISWNIPNPDAKVHRVLHVVRERGWDHYTNWGPKTRTFDVTAAKDSHSIYLCSMTWEQRQKLAAIAASTGVQEPNGQWNCQNWVETVLRQAANEGLLGDIQVDDVLGRASQ